MSMRDALGFVVCGEGPVAPVVSAFPAVWHWGFHPDHDKH